MQSVEKSVIFGLALFFVPAYPDFWRLATPY